MSAIVDKAKLILAAEIARMRAIPIEAADDIISHVQDLIYDYENGDNIGYSSINEIFDEYGIPKYLQWVFDM